MRGRGAGKGVFVWLLRILVVAGVLAVFFLKPFTDQTEDTASINTYDASMVLSKDGALSTEENLAVQMPSGKHGIFRIFDTADPRRDGIDHPVDIETIQRDGETEPYEIIDSAKGTTTAKIGSADVVLSPGEHDYRIVSSTVDALEPDPDNDDITLWWWDVVGQGWQMSMDSVHITAELPTEPEKVECVQGKDTPCTATVEGTTLTLDTGPLEPFTPVTVRVSFPANALPTPPAGDANSDVLTIGLSILFGLLAAGLGIYLFRATREAEPGFPVLFEPPEGIYPALGVKVLDEKASDVALQATLFDLAERGILQLAGDDDQWSVTMVADPATSPQWPAETAVLTSLGLTYQGATFDVSKSKSAGETISHAKSALDANVDLAAASYLKRSAAGVWAWLLGWVSLIAVAVMVCVYLFTTTAWVSWPLLIGAAVFALIALGMMFDVGVATKRTPEGREVWSRTGGFARFLTTDSSESRFEAAKHLDWYPRYLPWALALGSADAWAQRYQSQGIAPPIVPWILWSGTGNNFSMNSMNDSFNSAIAGASAAYAASQVSSGGGGGFGGGSGGGGGGGGSW